MKADSDDKPEAGASTSSPSEDSPHARNVEKDDVAGANGKNTRSRTQTYALAISLAAVAILGGYVIFERSQPELQANDPTDAIPTSHEFVEKHVKDIAYDLIRMHACINAWNTRVYDAEAGVKDLSDELLTESSEQDKRLKGTIYSYTSSYANNSKEVCGHYFVSEGANAARAVVREAQLKAIADALDEIKTAANDITSLVDLSNEIGGQNNSKANAILFKAHVDAAVKKYQEKAEDVIAGINKMPLDQSQKDWLIANSQPRTSSPELDVSDSEREQANEPGISGVWHRLIRDKSEDMWKRRVQVAQDMQKFEYYISEDLTAVPR
jgi:hypothetical protein